MVRTLILGGLLVIAVVTAWAAAPPSTHRACFSSGRRRYVRVS